MTLCKCINFNVRALAFAGTLLATVVALSGCGDQTRLSLTVNARGRAISSMPLIIAADRGLFEKYGLDVTLLLPPPDNGVGRASIGDFEMLMLRVKWRLGFGKRDGDVDLVGGTPMMLTSVEHPSQNHPISIGSTDCFAR